MNSTVKQQLGLSMVELLIALAISSFLILGITQIYIDNKRNYLFQQTQAGNVENQRFLDLLMDNLLSKAAYRRGPKQKTEEIFNNIVATTDCQAFKKGQAITPAKGGIGVCIRYFPLIKGELDCTGNQTPTFTDTNPFTPAFESGDPVLMVVRYKAATDLNGSLTCKVGTTEAELLTGIADFRMTFGLSSTPDRKIDRIVAFNNWTTSSGNIMQISYAALMANGTQARTSSDSKALTDWNLNASTAEKARITAGDKGQVFQIASNTTALRNQMP